MLSERSAHLPMRRGSQRHTLSASPEPIGSDKDSCILTSSAGTWTRIVVPSAHTSQDHDKAFVYDGALEKQSHGTSLVLVGRIIREDPSKAY